MYAAATSQLAGVRDGRHRVACVGRSARRRRMCAASRAKAATGGGGSRQVQLKPGPVEGDVSVCKHQPLPMPRTLQVAHPVVGVVQQQKYPPQQAHESSACVSKGPAASTRITTTSSSLISRQSLEMSRATPMRLAADLAFYSWQEECLTGGMPPSRETVALMCQDLASMFQVLELDALDVAAAFVILQRYYHRVHDIQRGSKAERFHLESPAGMKAVFAVYLSQAMSYDEPLTKRAWLMLVGGSWTEFVHDVLVMAELMEHDLLASMPETFAAFDYLTSTVEVDALAFYQAVDAEAEARNTAITAQASKLGLTNTARTGDAETCDENDGDDDDDDDDLLAVDLDLFSTSRHPGVAAVPTLQCHQTAILADA